jgi:hypothetical protein
LVYEARWIGASKRKFRIIGLQLASAAKPPLRLALGSDALARIAEKNSFVAQETAEWRSLSESTDFKEI